jgi:hypothetical protein
MRFLVMVVSAGAALTLIAASGLMNWVFMSSLGKSEFERQILGAVSIAVSAFLALLPTLVLWAWRERRMVYVALGVPVFLAFGALSLSSAVGFAAKNRGSLSEDRALATAKLGELKHEIEEASAKATALGTVKPLAAVQASVHRLEQDWRWEASRSCKDASSGAMRSFCRGYFDLKAEEGRASEADRLEEQIGQLRAEARQLEEQGAGRQSDDQAAVLAHVLGLQTVTVEQGLTFFLAVLVEVGAALGLYFATGHMRPREAAHPQPSRGVTVIEGEIVKDITPAKVKRDPARQIPADAPRRVPRLSRT